MSPPASLVYAPARVRELDRLAIAEGIPGYVLMSRAGEAAFAFARTRWPEARRWLVVCGAGNNAGDGYVIARLAVAAGLQVSVAALSDPRQLAGDAATAWSDFDRQGGGRLVPFGDDLFDDADLVIDAMLGTGLTRTLDAVYRQAVEAINTAGLPVLAIDIPSGLDGTTGEVRGACVRASATISFVGLKQGFYLGEGPDHTGSIVFDRLGIPPGTGAELPHSLRLVGPADVRTLLPPRRATDHKGRFGHVLVIGGNHGMTGAVRLAGEAALRAGAGLVTVATRPENAAVIAGCRPELMCHGVRTTVDLDILLARATVVAIGPGLGQDDWARELFEKAVESSLPKVVDADALNLLAERGLHRDDWLLTPHPGEAGRLLDRPAAGVQADRLKALEEMTQRYGGTVLLKGRCTLVGRHGEVPLVIDRGNPGMATAGAGDVLTGLTAGLIAQTGSADAMTAGVAAFIHAAAGDDAAGNAPRGIIAGDLIAHFRPWLNPSP